MKNIKNSIDGFRTDLPYTIDLQTPRYNKQTQEYINLWLFKREKDIFSLKFIISSMIIFAILLLVFLPKPQANASEGLNNRDKIRVERLQTCSNALKESNIKPTHIEYIKLVTACAINMHSIYIMESWYWKHEVRKNNFLWLKRTVNWEYWFHNFKTPYDCRSYFATKWFEFHYKKTARTLIYWFWIDNQWKFWYSQTDREAYVKLIETNRNNKELARQYEYLLITN